jgi:hypothetical protein
VLEVLMHIRSDDWLSNVLIHLVLIVYECTREIYKQIPAEKFSRSWYKEEDFA